MALRNLYSYFEEGALGDVAKSGLGDRLGEGSKNGLGDLVTTASTKITLTANTVLDADIAMLHTHENALTDWG